MFLIKGTGGVQFIINIFALPHIQFRLFTILFFLFFRLEALGD